MLDLGLPDRDGIDMIGEIRIDLIKRQIWRGDAEIHLTPIKHKLLGLLLASLGKVVTHRQLLREVWGPSQVDDTHYLRVCVCVRVYGRPAPQAGNRPQAPPVHPHRSEAARSLGHLLVQQTSDGCTFAASFRSCSRPGSRDCPAKSRPTSPVFLLQAGAKIVRWHPPALKESAFFNAYHESLILL